MSAFLWLVLTLWELFLAFFPIQQNKNSSPLIILYYWENKKCQKDWLLLKVLRVVSSQHLPITVNNKKRSKMFLQVWWCTKSWGVWFVSNRCTHFSSWNNTFCSASNKVQLKSITNIWGVTSRWYRSIFSRCVTFFVKNWLFMGSWLSSTPMKSDLDMMKLISMNKIWFIFTILWWISNSLKKCFWNGNFLGVCTNTTI